ncbi:MAG TPA: hypothetical protein VFU76_06660 [Terriglobales bacterium]|nr:hypothetical protein [Terriglobales bacterium]
MRVRLFALLLLLPLLAGCHQADVHRTLARNLPANTEGLPVVLAVYEPWFGGPDHIDVGYSSHDRVVLAKQIAQAQNMGISAFVVDWYGSRHPFLDQSFALLQQVARENHFKVALMYDEPQDADDPTTTAINSLDYAYNVYIGPQAANQDAYLTYNGRPVVFVWPRSKKTDWKAVRDHLGSWASAPVLINEFSETPYAAQFDGFYAWVQPGHGGWQSDGSNWGRDYLDYFYRTMQKRYPDKIAVGAAWPGFNDHKASWSQNRYMDARCGKTFEESLRLFRSYYTASDPLPFLMVETWNDYEEGTAIERGINTCSGKQQGGNNTAGE